nr:hypothetical protein CFP56_07534 [Quercus suber]
MPPKSPDPKSPLPQRPLTRPLAPPPFSLRAPGDTLLHLIIVMRHLEPGALEAALDVEALVGLGAVEDRLVATRVLGDVIQRLDDAQPELLALLVFRDRDVFDVAHEAEVVDAAQFVRISKEPPNSPRQM